MVLHLKNAGLEGNFKLFGSLCHAHVPDEKRRKLDDKSEQAILVDYHPAGGYKLYSPAQKRIFVSRCYCG